MNPETLYPELKEMKSSEIFIEWAYIVRGFKLDQKVYVKRVIPKKEINIFIKALKMEYGVEAGPDKFECINLVTIEK